MFEHCENFNVNVIFCCFVFFKTGSCYVAQASLELMDSFALRLTLFVMKEGIPYWYSVFICDEHYLLLGK
jgi:hypothetical protein